MTKSYRFALALLAVAIATGVVATVEAQQGWSQVQTIQHEGKPATVNSVFFNGDEVWVVGADGLISRSYDDGRTFQEVNLGLDVGINDVFIRKERMWMVGDAGTIVLSTDGGRSFVKSLYDSNQRGRAARGGGAPPLDLYSVQFVDGYKGFIVGDEGLILATEDGGISWRERPSGTDAQLFHLSFVGKRGWVVGTGGVILHTSNGGSNWYPQVSGTKDDLNRVYLMTERAAVITGDKGTLLRTDNGGATWERVSLRTSDPLFGISFIDKNTGWVVGHNGRIIRTYDGGRNWVEQESSTDIDLFAVSFHKNQGYAIGRDGVVMRYYEKR
jgi:photosystem II stability/assembly factor-like uncharacterized protein